MFWKSIHSQKAWLTCVNSKLDLKNIDGFQHQGLHSLIKHRLISMGNPIINLRRLPDRLNYTRKKANNGSLSQDKGPWTLKRGLHYYWNFRARVRRKYVINITQDWYYLNQCWYIVNCTTWINAVRLESKLNYFHTRRLIWKCRQQIDCHFVAATHIYDSYILQL